MNLANNEADFYDPNLVRLAAELENKIAEEHFFAGKEGLVACIDACTSYLEERSPERPSFTEIGWSGLRGLELAVMQDRDATPLLKTLAGWSRCWATRLNTFVFTEQPEEIARIRTTISNTLVSQTKNKSQPPVIVSDPFDALLPALITEYIRHANNGSYSYASHEKLWQDFAEKAFPHLSVEDQTKAKLLLLHGLLQRRGNARLFIGNNPNPPIPPIQKGRLELDLYEFFFDTVARYPLPIDWLLMYHPQAPDALNLLNRVDGKQSAFLSGFFAEKLQQNPAYIMGVLAANPRLAHFFKEEPLVSQIYWDFDFLNETGWSTKNQTNLFYMRINNEVGLGKLLPPTSALNRFKGYLTINNFVGLLHRQAEQVPRTEASPSPSWARLREWGLKAVLRAIQTHTEQDPLFARWVADHQNRGSKKAAKKIEKKLFAKAARQYRKHNVWPEAIASFHNRKMYSLEKKGLVQDALLEGMKKKLSVPLSLQNMPAAIEPVLKKKPKNKI